MKKQKEFSNKAFLSYLPHLAAGFLATQGDPLLTTFSFLYLALNQIARLNQYRGALTQISEWVHITTTILVALRTTALPGLHIGLLVTLPISIVFILIALLKNRLLTIHEFLYLICIVVFFFLYRESPLYQLPFILIFYDILFIGSHPAAHPDYLAAAMICILHIFTEEPLFTFAIPFSYLAARGLVLIFKSVRACLKDEKCRSNIE